MNPWEVFGWVAAVCLAVVVAALTALVVVAAVQGIMRGRRQRKIGIYRGGKKDG